MKFLSSYFKKLREEIGVVLSLKNRWWFWLLILGAIISPTTAISTVKDGGLVRYFISLFLTFLVLFVILQYIASKIKQKQIMN